MQTVIAIGCLVVLLLIGVPLATKYPWRVAMVVAFFAVHVAVMVGYEALIERLKESQRPAARRLVAIHVAIFGLMGNHPPYDAPQYKLRRAVVPTLVYLSAFAFYVWLLVKLGVVLDWLEATPEG
jgi:hypothetical protein